MWAKVDRFRRFGEAESQLVRPDGLAGRVFQSDATRSNFAGGPVTNCDFDPCVGEFAAGPTRRQNRRDENEEIFVNLDSSQDFVPDRFLPIIFADRIKGVDDPAVCERFARVEGI